MAEDEGKQQLAEIREALQQHPMRLEFSFAFNMTEGGTVDTVQVYAQTGGRWKKVGPFLTSPDNTRAALLRLAADLLDPDVERD